MSNTSAVVATGPIRSVIVSILLNQASISRRFASYLKGYQKHGNEWEKPLLQLNP